MVNKTITWMRLMVILALGSIIATACNTSNSSSPPSTIGPMPTISSTALATGLASGPANPYPGVTGVAPPVAGVVLVGNNPVIGEYLTNSKDQTLYASTKDEPYTSNCNDQCTKTWSPVIISGNAPLSPGAGVTANLGSTQRKDGSYQLTIDQRPVYTYTGDHTKGDVNGQGVGNAWYALDPSGHLIMKAVPTQTP